MARPDLCTARDSINANLTIGRVDPGSQNTIAFTGTSGILNISASSLNTSGVFIPTISGFSPSDVIDYAGTVTSASYSGGVLSLLNGSQTVATVACTPAAGWEKGQVENQVGNAREHLFTPRLHFADYDELNAWLEARCLAEAHASAHPEQSDKTVWEVFEAERASLIGYRGPFDGFHEVDVTVSKSSLVRFDHNRYSVAAKAARRTAQLRAYADRIVVWCDGAIVGEHARRFGRGQTAYDPWHYLPVLARKPGALRNGDPFRNWDLPPALAQIRRRLAGHDDGDRQFVDILTEVAEAGLDAVEAACAEALAAGLFGREVVLNILARRRDVDPPAAVATPTALALAIEPVADCARYDQLRRPPIEEACPEGAWPRGEYRGAA
jgi:hypothetical protein